MLQLSLPALTDMAYSLFICTVIRRKEPDVTKGLNFSLAVDGSRRGENGRQALIG